MFVNVHVIVCKRKVFVFIFFSVHFYEVIYLWILNTFACNNAVQLTRLCFCILQHCAFHFLCKSIIYFIVKITQTQFTLARHNFCLFYFLLLDCIHVYNMSEKWSLVKKCACYNFMLFYIDLSLLTILQHHCSSFKIPAVCTRK